MPIIDTHPSPAAWLAEQLPKRFAAYASDPDTGPWCSPGDLLFDDAATLRGWHARLLDIEHVPAPAAATYLAGWIGGSLAGVIGHALATTDAGFVVDHTVTWHQHPDGWIDQLRLGSPGVVVAAGHPWEGRSGVATVADGDVHRLAVRALVEVLSPLIEALHGLGRTGRVGLWNEVGDELGLCLAHQPDVPVRTDLLDTVAAAVRVRGVPWRTAPDLLIVESDHGEVYLGRKGGCCLSYTCPTTDDDPAAIGDDDRAFLDRFPRKPGEPAYCNSCKFRDLDDAIRRQLFWVDPPTSSSSD